MDTTYEDTVFDFDLNLLHQTPNSASVQTRLDKQRKAISTVKKKTVATDSLIRKYYGKRELLEQSEKALLASKEECKQICIDYRNALANCTKVENEAQLLQLRNKELEEKCFHAVNQTGAVQSHANQLQLLVKQHETVIESLKIESKLERSNPKEEKKIISLQKEKEALLKDICLFKDIVLGKRKLKKCHNEILQKYQKLSNSYCDEESDGDEDNEFEEVPSPLCEEETVISSQNNSQDADLDQKLISLKDNNIVFEDSNLKSTGNAHEYDCSTEVTSVDTGRGSSLAYSDSEKCYPSPDYVMDNSPLNCEINTTAKHTLKLVDIATSPITVHMTSQVATSPIQFEDECTVIEDLVSKRPHLCDKALSPFKLTKHVEVSTSPIKKKSIGIVTSPDRVSNNNKKCEKNSLKIQEKECLELNSSNNVCNDNTSDSEIEMILSTMRINHTAISPIPPTPARPQDAGVHNANDITRQQNLSKGYVCEEAAIAREENKKLHASMADLAKEVMSIKNLLKHQLLSNPSFANNQNAVSNQGLLHDNIVINDHEELHINISETNNYTLEDQHQNEDKLMHIERHKETDVLNEECNVDTESDLIQIHDILDSNNPEFVEPLEDVPGTLVSHRLQFEHSVLSSIELESDAVDYGEYINREPVNNNDKETCNLSVNCVKENKEKILKRARLTRLQKLRKKLIPKCKIRRETPTFKRMRAKPKPLPLKKIIKETDSSASLNDRSVYDKAVKIMAELKANQNAPGKHLKSYSKLLQTRQKVRGIDLKSKKQININNELNMGTVASKDLTNLPNDKMKNKQCFVAISPLSANKIKEFIKDSSDLKANEKCDIEPCSPKNQNRMRNVTNDSNSLDFEVAKKCDDVTFSPRRTNNIRDSFNDNNSPDIKVAKNCDDVTFAPKRTNKIRDLFNDNNSPDIKVAKKCDDVTFAPRRTKIIRDLFNDSNSLDLKVTKKSDDVPSSPRQANKIRHKNKKSNSLDLKVTKKSNVPFSPRRANKIRRINNDGDSLYLKVTKNCNDVLFSAKRGVIKKRSITNVSDSSNLQVDNKCDDVPFSPKSAITMRSISKDSNSSDSLMNNKCDDALLSTRSAVTARKKSKDSSNSSDSPMNNKCDDALLSTRSAVTARKKSKDSSNSSDSPMNNKCDDALLSPRSAVTTRRKSKDSSNSSDSPMNNKCDDALLSPRSAVTTRRKSKDSSNSSDSPINNKCDDALLSPTSAVTPRRKSKDSSKSLDSPMNNKCDDALLSPSSAVTTRSKSKDSASDSPNNKIYDDVLFSPKSAIKTRSMSKDSNSSDSSINKKCVDVPFSPRSAITTRSMSNASNSSDAPIDKNYDSVRLSPKSTNNTSIIDSSNNSINKKCDDELFSPRSTITRSMSKDSDSSDSQIVVCIIEEINEEGYTKCDSSQTEIRNEDAENIEKCVPLPETRQPLKRSAEDKLEAPSKRILRSSTVSKPVISEDNKKTAITNSASSASASYTQDQKTDKLSVGTHKNVMSVNTTNVDNDRLVSYTDLQLFSDTNVEQNIEDRSTTSDNLNPKGSILCAMIEKYGTKCVKMHPKKIPETVTNAIYKELQEAIAQIVELPANETNNAMRKLVVEIQNMNMKHFIVGLIQYLKDPTRKAELFNKINSPPAPAMTKCEQVLLFVITQLHMSCPSADVIGNILDNIEYQLFKLNRTPEFNAIETMSHFYAILCRFTKAKSRLRLFILDAMYCIQYKSIALIKQCIEVWMHILPLAHMGVAKSPLVTCLVYLLHFYKCEDRFNRVQDMRNILNRKYFYKITEWNETKILQMLETSIMEIREIPIEKKMLRMALIIISKRHGPKWCQNHIVKNLLLPIIENESIPNRIRLFCVSMLGPVLKPYPNNMKVHCEVVMNQLLDIFGQNPSHQMQEAIVTSLIYLGRHNQYRINQLLLSWKPKYVSPSMEAVLRDYVREKPLKIWESTLSRIALS